MELDLGTDLARGLGLYFTSLFTTSSISSSIGLGSAIISRVLTGSLTLRVALFLGSGIGSGSGSGDGGLATAFFALTAFAFTGLTGLSSSITYSSLDKISTSLTFFGTSGTLSHLGLGILVLVLVLGSSKSSEDSLSSFTDCDGGITLVAICFAFLASRAFFNNSILSS